MDTPWAREALVPSNWPPWCCVVAFVTKALEIYGTKDIDLAALARSLGVRTGVSDANPWKLPVATRDEELGVSPKMARHTIPQSLSRHCPGLGFRYVPFREVQLQMHDAAFEDAAHQGCVIGVGYNYRMLMGREGCIRHVARVVDAQPGEKVILIDDYTSEEPQRVHWSDLERAVYSVDDGFWIIGKEGHLSFNWAPIEL